jgi:YVTN family beta-propeller protein
MRFSADGKLAFVALGPANRVAVIDAATKQVIKYLVVGRRVWQLDLTPDGKYLLTTNGVSNDVSVIDVAALRVIKSIQWVPFLGASRSPNNERARRRAAGDDRERALGRERVARVWRPDRAR